MFLTLLLKLLSTSAIQQIAVKGIEAAVASTETTIDDKFLEAFHTGCSNKDYGLQRKPTGPRPNRRKASGKKA